MVSVFHIPPELFAPHKHWIKEVSQTMRILPSTSDKMLEIDTAIMRICRHLIREYSQTGLLSQGSWIVEDTGYCAQDTKHSPIIQTNEFRGLLLIIVVAGDDYTIMQKRKADKEDSEGIIRVKPQHAVIMPLNDYRPNHNVNSKIIWTVLKTNIDKHIFTRPSFPQITP